MTPGDWDPKFVATAGSEIDKGELVFYGIDSKGRPMVDRWAVPFAIAMIAAFSVTVAWIGHAWTQKIELDELGNKVERLEYVWRTADQYVADPSPESFEELRVALIGTRPAR